MICKFCNRECKSKNSLIQHQLLCKSNPDRREHTGGAKKGCKTWNTGLTRDTDSRIKEQSDRLKEKYRNAVIKPSWIGRKHTEETKAKIAIHGGYRKGSGRGKKGWYKGYFCDSSWELAYVIYNLDHGIKFERNKEKFKYIFEGKEYSYLPDFIVDGKYVEVKGYWTKQWQAKLDQFPRELSIIGKEEIKTYLEYVENKYGRDFIKLYE